MTPEKLREAAISVRNGAAHIRAEKCSESVEPLRELLAQHNELAADACTTLAAQMTDASVDFEGFDEYEGAAISQKTIANPTPQNIYDYGKAVWQAALALCERNRAAQMESATQGFEEWGESVYRDMWEDLSIEEVHDLRTAWHAAQAAMQAKLDAANAEIAAFKQAAQRDGQHFMPTTLKMGISDETREVCHLHDELVCDLFVIRMEHYIEQLRADLNAANARVKELEADVYARYLAMSEVVRLLGHACTGLAHEDIAPKVKERLAALSTAERERELLRKEVRRMDQLIGNPHSNPTLYGYDAREAHRIIKHERSAEVRALVEGEITNKRAEEGNAPSTTID